MAKKKNSKVGGMSSGKSKSRSVGSKPVVWIVLGVLLLVVIFMLIGQDEKVSSENLSEEFNDFYSFCLSNAQNSLRAEFCKYNLVNGDLVNCRDSRILAKLVSDGVDTTLGSLNCKSIDIYSYRKDVCSLYSVDTKIADVTCADYK